MDNTKSLRNPYIDLVKFILACSVVFIHFVIPNAAGDAIDCIARIAVPFFFIISGYYSNNLDASALSRRLWRNLALLAGSSFVYFIWGLWQAVNVTHIGLAAFIGEKVTVSTVCQFLFLGVNQFSTHLWFIHALAVCYLFLIVTKGLIRNRKLLMIILIIAHFALGTIIPLITDVEIKNYYYRNAWLFGIPMFLLGMYIRHNKNWNKIVCASVFVIGIILGLLQWFKFDHVEMPVGVFFSSLALFMLVRYSSSDNMILNRITFVLGRASMWIYVLHKLIGEIIHVYIWSDRSKALFPVIVMIVTVLVSLIITCSISGWRKRKMVKR